MPLNDAQRRVLVLLSESTGIVPGPATRDALRAALGELDRAAQAALDNDRLRAAVARLEAERDALEARVRRHEIRARAWEYGED
jgi:hypothetical protein